MKMDSVIAIGLGLGLRALLDAVTNDVYKSSALVGIWEGVVLNHFLTKMPKSYDPYVAFGVRLFVDFLFTESLEPSKKQWARMSQEIDIPLGYSQNMHKAHPGAYDQLANVTILRGSSAWTEVQPGDCIFARDKDSDGDPMKDVLWISVAIE